eukprot:scaffold3099_cov100-Isochrysis_galbana.AAC.9
MAPHRSPGPGGETARHPGLRTLHCTLLCAFAALRPAFHVPLLLDFALRASPPGLSKSSGPAASWARARPSSCSDY